jgi:ribose-phosphate pyrophosphokinase
MRQDRRFRRGEAVTSRSFARLLSNAFDWLVTVDPHLHRYPSLDALYEIPTVAVHAAPLLSAWIRDRAPDPVVIGPDGESAQWASAVAAGAGAPHLVLEKVRRGDREVEVSVPDVSRWSDRTPVLVDDIISTARTMADAVRRVRDAGLARPWCLGVHAVFTSDALAALEAAGAAGVFTCNTITHPTNRMDASDLLADALAEWLTGRPSR